MRKCGFCGGSRLKRVHRTFFERFSYMAIYECRDCENEEFIPRRFTFHLGENARCPKCGTFRVTKLRGLDKIDKMYGGLLNSLERMSGGNLFHCCFCRIQFYDRRPMAPRTTLQPIANGGEPLEPIDTGEPPPESAEVKELPDKASSGE
jgi:hypothetical protein